MCSDVFPSLKNQRRQKWDKELSATDARPLMKHIEHGFLHSRVISDIIQGPLLL